MEDFGVEFQKFSAFNMSIATLMRIDSLLQGLNSSFMASDFFLYHRGLMCLYKEIFPFLNKDERKAGEVFVNLIRGGVKVIKENIVFSPNTIETCDTFDFWIRDRLNDKGLLMSRADDPSRSLK